MEMIECEAFLGGTKQILQQKLVFRPAVYAMIVKKHKLLLVNNRRTGKYYLPGGGVDLGEPMEMALQREVKEETGLEIDIGTLLSFKENFFYYDPLDEAFHGFLFFYHCTAKTFNLLSNDQIEDGEAENPRWVAIDTLYADQFQGHSEMILKNLQTITT